MRVADGPFDFAVALDEIGNAEKTLENWLHLSSIKTIDDPPFIPVFQWGGDRDHLSRYLDEAPLVGIGGLVTLMREKNQEMLDQLGELCSVYPIVSTSKDLITSGDTSKLSRVQPKTHASHPSGIYGVICCIAFSVNGLNPTQ